MTDPTSDADGYPTDETLAALRAWPMEDAAGALDFMRRAWKYDGVRDVTDPCERSVLHATADDRFIRFATAGWSGNEELIHALRGSLVWTFTWRLSAAGGLHIFKVPK